MHNIFSRLLNLKLKDFLKQCCTILTCNFFELNDIFGDNHKGNVVDVTHIASFRHR